MNNRYLFKAKRKNWRELPKEDWWIQGCLIIDEQDENRYFIGYVSGTNEDGTAHDFDVIEVEPNSICRSTGLKDKAKNLIWENDVVEIPTEDGYFSVDWDEDTARFAMNGDGLTVDFDNYWPHEVEVVGNRVDDPELLEAE